MTDQHQVSEVAAWLVILALLFVTWLGLIGREEEPSTCHARCFRHDNRSRFHVPCSRCFDRHPLR